MKHTIEISTVDALLIVQLLHEKYFENETDRNIAEKLRDKILTIVGNNLSEQTKEV